MPDITVIWGGVTIGAFYALLGLSYLLILMGTRTLNFGVGGFAVFAAVGSAVWAEDTSRTIALLAAIAAGCVLAIASDTLVARPIQARDTGHYAVVIALAAVFFVVVQITGEWLTAAPVFGQPLSTAVFFEGRVTGQSVILVAAAVLATAAAWAWFKYGRRGRLLSAVGDEWQAAVLLCLPIGRLRILAVALGGLLAGIAGVLISGQAPVNFHSGFSWALVGLVALMIGGAASAWGPLVGGLIIGLSGTLGTYWVGSTFLGVRDYVLLAVVLLVFKFRPEGLFAKAIRV
jgi:branched-chain amino acid transport system permease protein